MRGYVVVALVMTAACGSVDNNKKQDAAVQIDTNVSIDSPMTDASIDAAPICMMDGFDTTGLDSHWVLIAGGALTHSVTGSKISITDAPLATTPSNTDESWINEVSTDKGNQYGWAHSIGTGDFVVRSHLDTNSVNGDLMIAGVAVVDSTAHIVAFAGFNDGQQGNIGGPYSVISAAGADTTVLGAIADPASNDIRIERTGGVIKTYIANTETASLANSTAITHVSIVAVPYKDATMSYPFGTAELTFVEVCY